MFDGNRVFRGRKWSAAALMLAAAASRAEDSGKDYCPDGPVNRRQMAIFLAKALGLHWSD